MVPPADFGEQFGRARLQPAQPADPALQQLGGRHLQRQLGAQQRREFIAADRITIADVVAFTGLDFARMVKFTPAPEHTHLARWIEAMRNRPAASAGV